MVLVIFLGIVALGVTAAIITGMNWVLEHGNMFTWALVWLGGLALIGGVITGTVLLSISILT